MITPPTRLAISVVGVYPKPSYLPIPTWYVEGQSDESYMSCDKYDEFMAGLDENRMADLEVTMARAQRQVIDAQVKRGFDIITDGEIYRDFYVFHFLRQCDGVDFKNAETTVYRDGACSAVLPIVSGAVKVRKERIGFTADIWEKCQAMTTTPVKVTLPGPMTITNTSGMRYYKTERASCEAFAECLRQELVSLVQRGCKYIQIDEPLIARKNEAAVDYGIDILSGLLRDLPDDVVSTVHICCGYTQKLDHEGYRKANPETYTKLSKQLDDMGVNAISIEGTFCGEDLSFLSNYKKTTIMLGIISVCKSRVEPAAELTKRIRAALKYIPASRLIIAPDCGLGLLPKDILNAKLSNMVQAVREVRDTLPN